MTKEVEDMLQGAADDFDTEDATFEEDLKLELMALGLMDNRDPAYYGVRDQYYAF